jgi:hypothetical protein
VSRLVDHEALLLDLRGELAARESWGRSQILVLLSELEQRHRIDESDEAAVLRRFGSHLTDTFFGLVPRLATTDPLSVDDPAGASVAMDGGAPTDQQTEGAACLPPQKTPPSPAPMDRPASRSGSATRVRHQRRVPATR